ncbi:tyrosine-type recombinase/integrase [Bacillaceae bacterium S4-13-58]
MLIKFAYQDFIEDRKFKNTSEENIRNYQTMLREFVDYCPTQGVVNVEDITYNLVRQYLMDCQQRGNKPGSINSKLHRIRAFLNYMIECEVIKENPAKKVSRQKEDVKIDVFTDNHIKQMLAYYRRIKQREKSYYAYRDYMLILVFLGTGIRRSEAVKLKWDDIDLQHLSMSIFGKNRKKDTLPITAKLAKELSAYRLFCEQYFSELGQYLFVNIKNQPMTNNSVTFVFRNLSKKMNFKDIRVSPHTFRHTFCHRLALSGMSPFAIQKMMRHEDISVTMRYVAMWGNDLREQADKHNPLNDLDI